MGNRAVITTKKDLSDIGIYLHWNGGRDSVEAFLKYCELLGHRSPDTDNYGWARLAQVIANYFGGTTSIGIDIAKKLDCDNGDNGVYIIQDWQIVDRLFAPKREQKEYEMLSMLLEIDSKQPTEEQLGKNTIEYKLSGVEPPANFKQDWLKEMFGDVMGTLDEIQKSLDIKK